MSLLDLVVLAVGALAGWSGWRRGGVRTVSGLIGRFLGLAAGLAVAHLVARTDWAFGWRVVAEIAVVLVGWVIGARAAGAVAPRGELPSTPDRVVGVAVRGALGVVLAAAVVAGLVLWTPVNAATAGSLTARVATPGVTAAARDLRSWLPSDLDGVVPAISGTTAATGSASLPNRQAAATVQVLTQRSTGDGSTGSGFVVTGDRVVTAHHVVVDAEQVVVVAGDTRYPATVSRDDPRGDVAVLQVDGLDAPAVTVSAARVAPGTPAVFAGYPGGGPFQVGTATVVGGLAVPTSGSAGVGLRPVYRLAAVVRPGNSGGPLYDLAGDVVGMIDARSLTTPTTGFAVTTEPVLDALTGR